MVRTLLIASLLASILQFSAVPSGATELVMFRKDGCAWCAAWEREIGEVYPETDEAQRAPIRRVDLGEPLPDDLLLDRRITYTPTFVLVAAGREIGRITGYPGEAFFWGRLGELLAKLDEHNDREDPS